MKNLLKVAALLAVIVPSQAWADKSIGEQCTERKGMWVGDPIGSMDKGYCLIGSSSITAAKCKAVGGTSAREKCKLDTAAFSKYVKQGPR